MKIDWKIKENWNPLNTWEHPNIQHQSSVSYLITNPDSDVAHFDLPTLTNPQTLALHVLNPDVNTWSDRGMKIITVKTEVNQRVTSRHNPAVLPSKQYEDGWFAEVDHSKCPSVWLLQEEKTPELRSSDEWSESLKRKIIFLKIWYNECTQSYTYRYSPSLKHLSATCPSSWNRTEGRLEAQGTESGSWCLQLHLTRDNTYLYY